MIVKYESSCGVENAQNAFLLAPISHLTIIHFSRSCLWGGRGDSVRSLLRARIVLLHEKFLPKSPFLPHTKLTISRTARKQKREKFQYRKWNIGASKNASCAFSTPRLLFHFLYWNFSRFVSRTKLLNFPHQSLWINAMNARSLHDDAFSIA